MRLIVTAAVFSTFLTGQAAVCRADEQQAARRPNVLFIAVDDLNHWVGHLGRNVQAKTPNIDRLAARGVTFTNAHCAAPVCNPSRTALLSGMRPSTTGVYDNGQPFTQVITSGQSLVSQFKAAGYETLGMGKLWHGGLGFPDQWTATGGRETAGRLAKDVLDDRSIGGIAFGVLNGGDELVPDTQIADYAIDELSKSHESPFFLVAGFHKPHMPWNVPRKYFDLHPLESIELPPTHPGDLDDIPASGLKFAKAQGDHANVLASGRWKEAVQAYLAAISYLDGQVGRLLDALDASPHKDNTIICLWGDHGWHLGEKEHWRKFALWEEATRAPFIWVVPGVTNADGHCDAPVDFMSIYPTLCDLAGVAIPNHVEGRSIRSLLADPQAAWDGVAVTTHGRNNHAVRSDRWRYIRYADGGEELYDHIVDEYEWTNLAARDDHADVRAALAKHLPSRNADDAPRATSDPNPARDGKKAKKKADKRQANARPVASAVRLPAATNRPNILWFIVEDMSAHYSCYGETTIQTPNVDQLASGGIRFTRAFVTAPICSISRSALITGRYQTSIGAQNHRSSVAGHVIRLPDDTPLVPALLKSAGYHTNNLTVDAFLRSDAEVAADPNVKVAKTDYNFEWDEAATYNATHWSVRGVDQPFFVQVQLHGGKYRGPGIGKPWPTRVRRELGSITGAKDITLPPYLPDDPAIREDWAQYLDTVRYTDWEVGRVVQRLKDSGEFENTVIFFITDHGISHVRNKQFLYDGGTHIPLIIHGPGIPAGETRDDLVEHIDLAATSLALAGIAAPDSMQARDILAADYQPREYVFAARDRADETVDLIRSVRDTRWKYIRNGFPSRPYLQPNNYKDNKPIVQAMRLLHAAGKLTPEQSLIMAETRPLEELYDTQTDPWELHNLAAEPQHAERLALMRAVLRDWQLATGDVAQPEPEDVYKTEVSIAHAEGGKNTENEQYRKNVDLMLRWAKERPLVPLLER